MTNHGSFGAGAHFHEGDSVAWRRWFVKAARDAHVNYSADTMWRFGGGVRF